MACSIHTRLVYEDWGGSEGLKETEIKTTCSNFSIYRFPNGSLEKMDPFSVNEHHILSLIFGLIVA